MVVSVAGDCDHDDVVGAIEERFAGHSGGAAPERSAPNTPVEPLVVLHRPTEQAHLALGLRCVSRFDDDRWAFSVLNHVLGGGMSSRLFQKVREQRGLAYSIGSERLSYQDAGSLCVFVGTAPDNVDEVLGIVSDELELLATAGVTERELAIAKGNLRAETLLACEDSGARMSRIGAGLLLHGEAKTVDEILSLIDRVGLDDVHRVARLLIEEPHALAVVGPFDPDTFDGAALGLAGHVA
jgi:predicted Zn-dependent peptidase